VATATRRVTSPSGWCSAVCQPEENNGEWNCKARASAREQSHQTPLAGVGIFKIVSSFEERPSAATRSYRVDVKSRGAAEVKASRRKGWLLRLAGCSDGFDDEEKVGRSDLYARYVEADLPRT